MQMFGGNSLYEATKRYIYLVSVELCCLRVLCIGYKKKCKDNNNNKNNKKNNKQKNNN